MNTPKKALCKVVATDVSLIKDRLGSAVQTCQTASTQRKLKSSGSDSDSDSVYRRRARRRDLALALIVLSFPHIRPHHILAKIPGPLLLLLPFWDRAGTNSWRIRPPRRTLKFPRALYCETTKINSFSSWSRLLHERGRFSEGDVVLSNFSLSGTSERSISALSASSLAPPSSIRLAHGLGRPRGRPQPLIRLLAFFTDQSVPNEKGGP